MKKCQCWVRDRDFEKVTICDELKMWNRVLKNSEDDELYNKGYTQIIAHFSCKNCISAGGGVSDIFIKFKKKIVKLKKISNSNSS